ncbi:hypothetical protein [Kitasatospora sp. NPDC048407]|uniref:hypothetical protein n=1 Tax=Kitasatospora sp. NPDC048407 TaxID=3364051 RepID=UPI0037106E36
MPPRQGRSGPSSAFRHRSSAINTATSRSVRAGIAVTTGAVLIAAGVTACGTAEKLSAGQKVTGAFKKLGDAKSMSLQLSFDATSDQIVAFGKAVDDPIEKKSADLLSDLVLNVSLSADKPLKDTEVFKFNTSDTTNDSYDLKGVAVAYSLSAKKSGKTYADVRLVGERMYLKADVRGIAELAGKDTKEVDEFVSVLPAEAGPIKDVVDGKWVSLDVKKMQDEIKKSKAPGTDAGVSSGSPLDAMPGMDPAELKHLVKSLKAVISKNTSVEDKGKSGDADVIEVSAQARPLIEGLAKTVEKAVTGKDALPSLPTGDFEDIPDRKIAADVMIKGGKAQAITFDLMQLADKPDASAHFPLRLGINSDAPAIDAPSGATELDLQKLGEAFMSMAAPGGKAGGKGSGFGSDGPDATPLTDAQYAELAAAGIDHDKAKNLNAAGLSFQDIKDFADAIKG